MDREITEECVAIPCGTFLLKGVLSYAGDGAPARALLLFNPHPHLGGNMKNNVIRHIALRGAQDGAVTLRFDYRGVGDSGFQEEERAGVHRYYADIEANKQYDKMVPDCIAAAEWLEKACPGMPVVYVGYSLGTLLAAMLAALVVPAGLACVSPPNRRISMAPFGAVTCRKVFIAGEEDFVFDPVRFKEDYETFSEPKSFRLVSGSGHFFRGREEEVYQGLHEDLFV